MRNELKPKSFGAASVFITLIFDATGYVWHGILQQPSLINIIYPGFWGDPASLAAGLITTVAGAYALGYAFAWAYNKYN
ncbi:MAG: hypothetical protein HY364_00575 [Candidatus Aenigmarchaeota archaeon]|nr:hypothetical protein [Candidatus Aenigmarchaeota archaeon]